MLRLSSSLISTRLAVPLKIAEDVEDAGNEVKRLAPREVASVLKECGFREVAWRRTLLYYPHRPWRWSGSSTMRRCTSASASHSAS